MTQVGCRSAVLAAAAALSLAVASTAYAAPPEAPLTKPAAHVTPTTAVLHGLLNPNVEATAGYDFVYGSEGKCEGTTTEPAPPTTGKAVHVSAAVAGLTPRTRYTFCLVALGASGEEVVGLPLAFTTAASPPVVESETAMPLTSASATLTATINPEGEESTCKGFQYVSQESFARSGFGEAAEVPCQPESIGAATSGQAVAATVTGLSANTTYRFRAVAENTTGVGEGAAQTFLTPPVPPFAFTGPAAAVGVSTATVAGEVDPGGEGAASETMYRFQYGLTTAYGRETTPQNAGSGTTPLEVQARLEGLAADATYHYRIVASNDATGTPQTTFGQDQALTTLGALPEVTSFSVGAVTPSEATVIARIEPSGQPTRYELDLGVAPDSLAPTLAGEMSSPGVVSLQLAGLAPGTTYYVKLTAGSINGDSASPELVFSTPAAATGPSGVTQPLAPVLLPVPAIEFPSSGSGGVLGATTKTPSRAQRLAAALKACRRVARPRRHSCEAAARRRYRAVSRGHARG